MPASKQYQIQCPNNGTPKSQQYPSVLYKDGGCFNLLSHFKGEHDADEMFEDAEEDEMYEDANEDRNGIDHEEEEQS